jgi:hypothetical protein
MQTADEAPSTTTSHDQSATMSPTQQSAADLAPSELDADDQTLLNPPVQWSADLVKAIHKAVHEETMRTTVGALFLPHSRVHPKTTSVRPDLVVPAALDSTNSTPPPTPTPTPGQPGIFTLLIDEGITIRLNEIWVEFALTDQQVTEIRELEKIEYSTVLTLARRAAQYVGLGVDCVIQNGVNAYNSANSPAFFTEYVRWRPGQLPSDGGLLNLTLPAYPAGTTPTATLPYTLFYGPNGTNLNNSTNPFISADTPAPIIVNPVSYTNASPPAGVIWGENIFAAVAQGIANLTSTGRSGPFGLVLDYRVFADTYAPVGPESLVITADRIDPLCKVGIFSSGTLPASPPSHAANPTQANQMVAAYAAAYLKAFTSNAAPPAQLPPGAYTGVLVSVGGSSVDLVVGQHARTRWQQKDANGNHRFRVMHRFTLKMSDPGASQAFVFMPAANM